MIFMVIIVFKYIAKNFVVLMFQYHIYRCVKERKREGAREGAGEIARKRARERDEREGEREIMRQRAR
jgi:hypothetical protein